MSDYKVCDKCGKRLKALDNRIKIDFARYCNMNGLMVEWCKERVLDNECGYVDLCEECFPSVFDSIRKIFKSDTGQPNG